MPEKCRPRSGDVRSSDYAFTSAAAFDGKPHETDTVSGYANTAELLFEHYGVAGAHFTGHEDHCVNSRALPVLLNDAFQNLRA